MYIFCRYTNGCSGAADCTNSNCPDAFHNPGIIEIPITCEVDNVSSVTYDSNVQSDSYIYLTCVHYRWVWLSLSVIEEDASVRKDLERLQPVYLLKFCCWFFRVYRVQLCQCMPCSFPPEIYEGQ